MEYPGVPAAGSSHTERIRTALFSFRRGGNPLGLFSPYRGGSSAASVPIEKKGWREWVSLPPLEGKRKGGVYLRGNIEVEDAGNQRGFQTVFHVLVHGQIHVSVLVVEGARGKPCDISLKVPQDGADGCGFALRGGDDHSIGQQAVGVFCVLIVHS